jgi:hypothetical protein
VDRPAGRQPLGTVTECERPGPGAEERSPAAGPEKAVAPGRLLDERGGAETGGGEQSPSAPGRGGAAAVNKRPNRLNREGLPYPAL